MASSYGDVHRYLARTISSRGVITVKETLALLAKYTGTEYDSVQNLVTESNAELMQLQQKIKITHDELADEEVLVFISTVDDDTSKDQSFLSRADLEYFRMLLDYIVLSESRQITRTVALNLVLKMNLEFTMTQAENLLHKWCQMRYLENDSNSYILGLKTIHEFEGYFSKNMPEAIEECCMCKTTVFRGYNCPACALAVHTRCLQDFVKEDAKWPCCMADYSDEQLQKLREDSD